MIGFSHLILHVALCRGPAKMAGKPLDVRVVMAYRVSQPEMDRTFRVTRDEGGQADVEFDAMQGIYLMKVTQVGTGCGSNDFVTVLSEHDRAISVQLQSPPSIAKTAALIGGSAPPSFSYVRPAIVYFKKPAECNAAIGTPLTDGITFTNDLDAFYASVRPAGVMLDPKAYVIALRLRTATGGFHYLRVPVDVPSSAQMWPNYAKIDVGSNLIDYAASKPFDTLLCPRVNKTSV